MDAGKRRRLWVLATEENGWSAQAIGNLLGGISGKTLGAIVKRGSLRSKVAPTLDAWLEEYAHTLAFGPVSINSPSDPALSIAKRCIAMAEDLQSPLFDHEEKLRRLSRFISDLNERLEADIAAFQKWQERGK